MSRRKAWICIVLAAAVGFGIALLRQQFIEHTKGLASLCGMYSDFVPQWFFGDTVPRTISWGEMDRRSYGNGVRHMHVQATGQLTAEERERVMRDIKRVLLDFVEQRYGPCEVNEQNEYLRLEYKEGTERGIIQIWGISSGSEFTLIVNLFVF